MIPACVKCFVIVAQLSWIRCLQSTPTVAAHHHCAFTHKEAGRRQSRLVGLVGWLSPCAFRFLVPPMFQSGQGVTNRHGLPTWDRPFCAPDDSLGALTSTSTLARIFVPAASISRPAQDGRHPVLCGRGVRGLLKHRGSVCVLRWVNSTSVDFRMSTGVEIMDEKKPARGGLGSKQARQPYATASATADCEWLL